MISTVAQDRTYAFLSSKVCYLSGDIEFSLPLLEGHIDSESGSGASHTALPSYEFQTAASHRAKPGSVQQQICFWISTCQIRRCPL